MTAKAITGIILAGGKSKRIGTDKAHLKWGSATLIEHVIELLRPLADEVIVAVDETERFKDLNAKVVKDLIPGAHALGGLYTGLQAASQGHCFVCGTDSPFLNPGLIRFLCDQAEGLDLVIPKMEEGLQPLHAVYAKTALPAISEQIREKQWSLQALVSKIKTKIMEPDVIRQFDASGLSLFNINTPEDYAKAFQIQESMTRLMEPSRSFG